VNEFMERRAARLRAQAEYLDEGAEQERMQALGETLRISAEVAGLAIVKQRLLQLLCSITEDDPNIGWQDFVELAIDRLFAEANRLEDGG
jgi:hypothetical protein